MTKTTKATKTRPTPGVRIADATRDDAYSFTAYGAAEWVQCGKYLMSLPDLIKSEAEGAAFLRSKHMRWAADCSPNRHGEATAKDLAAYIANPRNKVTRRAVVELMGAVMAADHRVTDAFVFAECQNVMTLETRNSDGLDFHDVPVWALRAIAAKAYAAGVEAGKAAR